MLLTLSLVLLILVFVSRILVRALWEIRCMMPHTGAANASSKNNFIYNGLVPRCARLVIILYFVTHSFEMPMSFLVGPTQPIISYKSGYFLQVFLHFCWERSSQKMKQTK